MGRRLDEAMPAWHFRERHGVALAAEPEVVMRAAEDVTWAEVPMFRALLGVRTMWRGAFGGDRPVFDFFRTGAFGVLVRTDHDLVVGATPAAQLSATGHPTPSWAGDVSRFAGFDEPGHIKIGFDFSYDGARLSTETRVWAGDPRTRRAFGAYWLVIRGFSGLIRREWLQAIRRRARAAAGTVS